MGTLASKPDISVTMSDVSKSGRALLNAITAREIWGETSLQYLFGSSDALTLDTEFESSFHDDAFSGTPDVTFAFSEAAINAFARIDAVSMLDFTQTSNTSLADLVLVSADNDPNSDLEGFFNFPGTSFRGSSTTDSWQIGAFNSAMDSLLTAPEKGGGEYANWTIMHEIGHSLGLMHTHKESNGAPLAVVGKYMDNERYSVMSYNGASNADNHGHAVSFMALDIAALQALYGAETYNDGTSTYMLTNAKSADLIVTDNYVQIGRAYYCIWDSGGNDTISYGSLDKSVIINLNDATLDTSRIAPEVKAVLAAVKQSDFYGQLDKNLQQEIVDPFHHAGGFFSRVLDKSGGKFHDIDGGFSIAHGAQIENGIGGAAGDLIIGNEGINSLFGNSGADRLFGSGGIDFLDGDTQNDLLDGGKGNDLLDGGGGADLFIFSKGYGLDEIELFDSRDKIDLSGLPAIKNFNDLIKNHIIKHSDGIEIHAGSDSLILDDAKMSDLHNSDFIFR